ncbi:hypothetical protein RXV95_06920 [Novosphingobium sp. ZN18A2]|uniref:hypothetical protein n=1 Tax=Novosphingobium sp. ZN18A2 TaxID=3079861 RepID=UPI0030D16E36
MANTSGETMKRLAFAAMLGACCASLAACGGSDLAARQAAAEAKGGAAQRVAQTAREDANAESDADMVDDGDSADDSTDDSTDRGVSEAREPEYGSPTDPTTVDDDYGYDPNAGLDAAPNDFPAPPDPPMAGDINPDDTPPPD